MLSSVIRPEPCPSRQGTRIRQARRARTGMEAPVNVLYISRSEGFLASGLTQLDFHPGQRTRGEGLQAHPAPHQLEDAGGQGQANAQAAPAPAEALVLLLERLQQPLPVWRQARPLILDLEPQVPGPTLGPGPQTEGHDPALCEARGIVQEGP